MIAAPIQKTNEQQALLDLIRVARSPKLRTMREFAEQEIVIPNGPYMGERFRCENQPYSRLLFDALQDSRWRRKVVTGPSQSGKTLSAFAVPTLYHLFEIGETVICGLPSMDMAEDKWQEDLVPVIELTKYREFLPTRGAGSRGGTPTSIRFKNGTTLRFMGGQGGKRGDKQRAAFTSRVVVITETDGMDEASGNSREADPISQLEARTRSFGKRARIYMECTVSTNEGRTWREYQAGTASRIIVCCNRCGRWVTPERKHLVGWDDADSKVVAGLNAQFSCPECGECWTDEERLNMNHSAELLHRGEKFDENGQRCGEIVQTNTMGFRWNAFNNLFVETSQLGEDAWSADVSEDRANAEKEQKQFIWAEPVKEDTIEREELTIGMVRGTDDMYRGRCNGHERGELPNGTNVVTAMIDLGKYKLAWSINAHGSGWRHVPDYGFQATRNVELRGEEAAIETALRELITDLNTRYEINMGLVDCGHWGKTAKKVVAEFGPNWRCSMGDSQYHHPSKKTKDKKPSANGDRWYESKNADRAWVINFDPDSWKAKSHRQWMITPVDDEGQPHTGIVTLYGDDPRHHTEFAEQLTAEVFERRWKDGKGWVEGWWKKRKNNHLLDTDVGNLVAYSVANFGFKGWDNQDQVSWFKQDQVSWFKK